MMRTLQFTAIWAFGVGRGLEGIMGAALSATRHRDFFLWYSHSFTFSSKLSEADKSTTVAKPHIHHTNSQLSFVALSLHANLAS